jgi:hypothetical protein
MEKGGAAGRVAARESLRPPCKRCDLFSRAFQQAQRDPVDETSTCAHQSSTPRQPASSLRRLRRDVNFGGSSSSPGQPPGRRSQRIGGQPMALASPVPRPRHAIGFPAACTLVIRLSLTGAAAMCALDPTRQNHSGRSTRLMALRTANRLARGPKLDYATNSPTTSSASACPASSGVRQQGQRCPARYQYSLVRSARFR